MRFQINITLLLTALACPPLWAQTGQDTRDLQRDLETYRRVSLALDIDSLIAFMPPKMLEMIPSETLKMQMEQAFDNDRISMRFDSMTIGEYPEIKKAGDYLYTLVPYSGHMEMHFKEPRDSAFLEMLVPMLETQFSEGNVHILSEDAGPYLSIDMREKEMIAFKTSSFDTWKFIEDKRKSGLDSNDQQLAMIKMFVPQEVLDATQ